MYNFQPKSCYNGIRVQCVCLYKQRHNNGGVAWMRGSERAPKQKRDVVTKLPCLFTC